MPPARRKVNGSKNYGKRSDVQAARARKAAEEHDRTMHDAEADGALSCVH
jgi:hypothetical protein